MAKSIFILSFVTLLIVLLIVAIFIQYKAIIEHLKDGKFEFAYYITMVILLSFLILAALATSLFGEISTIHNLIIK